MKSSESPFPVTATRWGTKDSISNGKLSKQASRFAGEGARGPRACAKILILLYLMLSCLSCQSPTWQKMQPLAELEGFNVFFAEKPTGKKTFDATLVLSGKEQDHLRLKFPTDSKTEVTASLVKEGDTLYFTLVKTRKAQLEVSLYRVLKEAYQWSTKKLSSFKFETEALCGTTCGKTSVDDQKLVLQLWQDHCYKEKKELVVFYDFQEEEWGE